MTDSYEERRDKQAAWVAEQVAAVTKVWASDGRAKVIEPETYEGPNGQRVTQPLDPSVYGLGVLYAEQVDGDNVVLVHGSSINSPEVLRVMAVGPRQHPEYGLIQSDFWHATVYLALPKKIAGGLSKNETSVSILGGGVSDPRRVAVAARALTLAAFIAEQVEA